MGYLVTVRKQMSMTVYVLKNFRLAMAQISMINTALGMDRDTALETDIATRLAKMSIMAVDMLKKIVVKNAPLVCDFDY